MKKVLITGVSGQLASYMVDHLLETTNYQIYGMVRRAARPDYSNITEALANPRFKLVIGDLADSHSIDSLVKELKPDYCINFAAQSFVGSSWQIPEQTFDVDAIGVVRFLEAIRKHSPNCRFYNSGSSEQLSDAFYVPQDEKHPHRARSPYGAAKIAAHQCVKVWRESYGLYAIQGIIFNSESPRRGEEFITKKVTKAVAAIKSQLEWGQKVTPLVVGNLYARRDWSHAKDTVRGIWMMLNQEVKDVSELKEYVLSSNETHSVKEFIEKAFKVANIPIVDVNPEGTPPVLDVKSQQVNFIHGPSQVPLVTVSREFYRPAEVELLHGDSSKARTELGWQPEYSFDELVEEMVKYDIENYS